LSNKSIENFLEECEKVKKESGGKKPIWEALLQVAKDKYNLTFKDKEDLRDKVRKFERKVMGENKYDIEYRTQKDYSNTPRIAVMDLETLPGIGFFFQLFDINIGVDQIIKDTCMLGWSGKFLNEPEMYSDFMTSEESIIRDTERISKSCWNFISKSDYIIGHNFAGFDAKYINTEFLKHNLPPLKYGVVDTLSVAKQNMRFDSNKLSFINKKLGIREKISNEGFPLWSKCSDGDKESLEIMQNYCEGDILATEDLFYRLRPYVKNFNVSLYNNLDNAMQCPVCGSTNLNIEGYYYTGNSGKYESVRCLDCKCISRKKQNLLGKEKKKNLLVNS